MKSRKTYNSFSEYYDDLHHILYHLTTATSLADQAPYLIELKECDKVFIRFLNNGQDTNIKSVFFTRHGLCSNAQKDYGFAPNACVENAALIAMSKTGSITQHMLSEENNSKSYIVISPMLRARQTASKIIPDQFKGSIEIGNFITENSSYPSGKPILNMEGLESEQGFMTYVSSKKYDDTYFDNLAEILSSTNADLQQKSSTHLMLDNPQNINLTDNEKINLINSYIDNKINDYGDIDIWFIGHGKNTQNYFGTRYDIGNSMDFCETRKVIHFTTSEGLPLEFVTPYTININQTSGLFQGYIQHKELNMKPLITIDSIQYLENYVIDREHEHNISVEKAKEGSYLLLKELSYFAKNILGIDYLSKINATKHLIGIIKGTDTNPLTDDEVNTLLNERLGKSLKKYNIDIVAINETLKKTIQNQNKG